MNIRKLPRNYSESDFIKLMRQGQKKADYINRIIDTDIHINMASECNTPLLEKPKYLRNNYIMINNKNNINEKNQRYNNINNISINRRLNYINNNNQRILNNQYSKKDDEYNNNYDYDINNDFNNSLNLNKPFHRERRHFPLINNKGNFFKNITPFLQGNTERINSTKTQNEIYKIYYSNNNNQNNYNKNANNMKKIPVEKLRRNSSMSNMPVNRSSISDNLVRNGNQKEYGENLSYSMGNDTIRGYKYYNPYRYDYEGSRYGDKTYNYYLNSPMRGDISADWKFPPIYHYNYKSINGQKNIYSNY